MSAAHVMLTAVVFCAAHLTAAYDFTKFLPVSERCKSTILSCVGPKAHFTQTVDPGQQCALFNITKNGVDAYHCTVVLGLCTGAEFFKLREYACKLPPPKQNPLSKGTLEFYQVVEDGGQVCSGIIVECIKESSVATMFKQLELYCAMLGVSFDHFSFKTCTLETDDCRSEDFDDLLKVACGGENPSTSPSELMAFFDEDSLRCRQALDKCASNNAKAEGLIQMTRYCDALDVNAGGTTLFQCSAAPGGCTEKEADDLKRAFCPGQSKTIKATNLGARTCGHVTSLLSPLAFYGFHCIL